MARRCSETHILLLLDEPSRRIRRVGGTKLWRNAIFFCEHFTIVLDIRQVTREEGYEGHVQNSHFTTVLGVRRPRSDERIVLRRYQSNPPGVKRRRNFSRNLAPQPFSAATVSTTSQQFSATLLSTTILSSHSQQIFSAAILSRTSQPISADLLSSHSQHTFSAIILLWSGVGGQLFGHHLTVVSCFIMLLWAGVGGQILTHHVAMVKGWWFAI